MNQDKSHWCLLIDIPLALIMVIFALIGMAFTIVEISYCFGRKQTEEWFVKKYDNKLF
jgi:uncharacterized integral membrane protein